MNLLLPQPTLSAALRQVTPVSGKSESPISKYVLIQATDSRVRLTCTDMDLWLSATIDAPDSTPGSLCVPADALTRFVDSLPAGGQVALTATDLRLAVRCGRTHATLGAIEGDRFPLFERASTTGTTLAVDAAQLRRLFDGVADFSHVSDGKSEYRAFLYGVHFSASGGKMIAEATDQQGYLRRTLTCHPEFSVDAILPRPTVRAALKSLPDEGPVTVTVDRSWFGLDFGGVSLRSKMIDDQYVDLANITPKDFETTIEVETAALRESVERLLGLTAGDKYRRLHLDIGEGGIGIKTGATEAGEAEDHVDAAVTGPACRRLVKGTDFLRFLKPVAGKTMTIRVPVAGGVNAGSLVAEEGDWRGLVMMLRG